MSIQMEILQSKLHIPRVTQDLVPRKQLLERLTKHQQRPLSLICASAGYGKSTLVSTWLETIDRPSAWISLDKYDDDLVVFLTYFIHAVQNIYPETGHETLALLNAPSLPPLAVTARSLVNELAQLPSPFILVLDDLHVIRKTDIYDLLTELLRHPPRMMHLVICTRRDPPLPLTRLRARAQMTEIRSHELRFTIPETTVLLQQMGIQIDDAVVSDLTLKTEGWVTGLRLSALWLRHRSGSSLNQLPENIHYVADYLVEETLSQLDPPIQDFLLKTSILDRLCGSLCDMVTGLNEPVCNGQAYLEWFYEQNLFIIPLDDQQSWYRYHHLFQEILQNQLKRKRDEADIASLHMLASTWHLQNGLINEAIRHAVEAGDYHATAQIIERNRHAILDEDRWHVLKEWLALLPDEIKQQEPELMMAEAWVLQFQFALPAIISLMDTAEKRLENAGGEPALWGEIAYFRGWQWCLLGDSARSLAYLTRAREQIPQQFQLARGLTESYFGLASQMNGQKETAIRAFQRQLYYQDRCHHVSETRLRATLGIVHLLTGNLIEATWELEQLRRVAQENNNLIMKAWSSYLQAYIHYFLEELDQAIVLFTQTVNNRYLMNFRSAVDCLAGCALTYQALGQTPKANESVKLLLEFAQQSNDPTHVTVAISCQARLALQQGDLASAAKWLQMMDISTDVGTMLIWIEIPRLTKCRVLIAQGTETSLQQAVDMLRDYQQQNEIQHNTRQLIDIYLIQAQAYHRQGKTNKSLAVLEKAMILGQPGGVIRPFVEVGPELAGSLKKIRNQDISIDYIGQILTAIEKQRHRTERGDSAIRATPPAPITPHPFVESLTNREHDVLELLAERLSNKEIAAHLFISPLTVKKHTSSIYQKLGVNNRRQAVNKAISLKLLASP